MIMRQYTSAFTHRNCEIMYTGPVQCVDFNGGAATLFVVDTDDQDS